VLELAPYGSLATVLDELSSKREALESEGTVVSRAREAILGRELSYKIAFQVHFWVLRYLIFHLKVVKELSRRILQNVATYKITFKVKKTYK